MNDRFKFRVWDKRTEEMLDVRLISYFSTGNICRVEAQNAVGDIKILDDYKTSIEDIELMQSTGLKDKNGKLIYEGDIVKFYFDRDKVIGVIAWDNEHQVGFYVNTTDYFKDKYIINYDFLCGFNYEVIGNIYENKELLNEI